MFAVLVLTVLVTTSSLAADCLDPPPNARDLRDRVEAAGLAFAAMDEVGFAEEAARATSAIPCILEPLETVDIASFHRVKGLHAFTLGDEATTLRWFRAARSVDRDYAFPSALVPKGGRVHHVYVEAGATERGDTHGVEAAPGLEVRVNGVSTTAQPLEFPAVIQVLDGEAVLITDLRMVDDPFPPFPDETALTLAIGEPPSVEPPPIDPPPVDLFSSPGPKKRSKGALWATAITTGVVAAGLYGGAAGVRMQYDDDPTASRRHLTNGLYLASVGTGSVAIGLASVAVFTGRF